MTTTKDIRDVDGHVVIRHVFREAPWNVSRIATLERIERKNSQDRPSSAGRFFRVMFGCVEIGEPIVELAKLFVVAGAIAFGITRALGYQLAEFPAFPSLLVFLALCSVVVLVFYFVGVILIVAAFAASVDAPTMMDARMARRRDVARELSGIYSENSLKRALNVLSASVADRSTLVRLSEIGAALLAALFAIYQAAYGQTGVWLPILSGMVALCLALHAERRRTLAQRMKVAREIIEISLDAESRLSEGDGLIFG